MSPGGNVISLRVENQVEPSSRWMDLKQASEVIGVKLDALRKRMKAGKIPGRRISTPTGYKWEVLLDASAKYENIDNKGLNVDLPGRNAPGGNPPGNIGIVVDKYLDIMLKDKDERILEQGRHISTLEQLLKDFQARMITLEADKLNIENKLKLLPAPVEMVAEQLKERDQAIQELEKSLQEERQRPWWKKFFGIK